MLLDPYLPGHIGTHLQGLFNSETEVPKVSCLITPEKTHSRFFINCELRKITKQTI